MFDTKIGKIFFIGIGGIGMSGIAEVLVNLGFEVTGSDISENLNITRLRKLGVKINIGHSQKNINSTAIVVISSAIENDNNGSNGQLIKPQPRKQGKGNAIDVVKTLMGSHRRSKSTAVVARQTNIEVTDLDDGPASSFVAPFQVSIGRERFDVDDRIGSNALWSLYIPPLEPDIG